MGKNYKSNPATIALNSSKKEYNKQLRVARRATAAALAIRESIVDSNPKFAGPSTTQLEAAVTALSTARVFEV